MKKNDFLALYAERVEPELILFTEPQKTSLKKAIEGALEEELTYQNAAKTYAALGNAISDFDAIDFVTGQRLIWHLRQFILSAVDQTFALAAHLRHQQSFIERTRRIKAFEATKQIALLRPEAEINAVKDNTHHYMSTTEGLQEGESACDIPWREPHSEFSVGIADQDTLVTARKAHEAGFKPFVLNLANKLSIGGGVETGALAQEEVIFQRTDLFLSLYPHGRYVPVDTHNKQHLGRHHYNEMIGEFASYYSGQVTVLADEEGKLETPFAIAVGTMAGYDLGKPEYYEPSLKSKGTAPQDLMPQFKELTKTKIRHILDVALLHGHDYLILGALSCGAFRLENDNNATATYVAEAYRAVLLEDAYFGQFKHIEFAIYSGDRDPNYAIFKRILAPLLGKHAEMIRPADVHDTPIDELFPRPPETRPATTSYFFAEPDDPSRPDRIDHPPLTLDDLKTDGAAAPVRAAFSTNLSLSDIKALGRSSRTNSFMRSTATSHSETQRERFERKQAEGLFTHAISGKDDTERYKSVYRAIEKQLGLTRLALPAYAFYVEASLPYLVQIDNRQADGSNHLDALLNLSPFCDQFVDIKAAQFRAAALKAFAAHRIEFARQQDLAQVPARQPQ